MDQKITETLHRSHAAPRLRAGVLGANDGLLSTASLILGVAAANQDRAVLITAGLASLVAGAMSMAVGEYSSVSSQLDTEKADLAREEQELLETPEAELKELAGIYRRRGLSAELAQKVAEELSAGDALRHHARDELMLDPDNLAQPKQAAITSALSFCVGASFPVAIVSTAPASWRVVVTVIVTLVGLGLLGVIGAGLGGAPRVRAAVRVCLGGALALGISTLIGSITGNFI